MQEIPTDKQLVEKTGFIARYFSDIRTISLVVLTLVGAGIVVFINLPKELNPSIKIPIVTISTVYPGASPEDIKELITVPIEDSVSGLKGVTKTSSTSQEGLSLVTLEFTSSTDPDQAKQDVQGRVDTVTGIPKDALDSNIQVVDFQNQPVLTFALSGDTDPQTLRLATRELEKNLKDLPSIERVELRYDQPLEVSITLKESELKTKQLNPFTLSALVEKTLSNIPGGNVSTKNNTFALGIDRTTYTVEDIRTLPVTINGQTLLLGDIATIEEKPAPNNPTAQYATKDIPSRQAVFFSVFKTDSANATTSVEDINREIRSVNERHGSVLTAAPIFDGAREIKKSFDQLFHDFFLTVGLVFVILILFFGIRQSIVSSLAIPLTFLITFIIMGGAGISINFIALFSLLLALGILVDNVIVIISAMASYERLGHYTPSESALLVYRDFRSVIFTTTITTIWAFLPLLLATGIIGEFIRPIPIVVSSALAVSALIALFVVIPVMATLQTGYFARRVILFGFFLLFLIGATLLFLVIPAGPYQLPIFLLAIFFLAVLFWQRRQVHRFGKTKELHLGETTKKRWHQIADEGFLDLHPLALRYERFIRDVLSSRRKRKRTVIALLIFAFFSYALVPAGFVVNEFFPADDQEIVYASVTLPKGTALSDSERETTRFIEEIRTLPDVRFVTAEVGAGVPTDSGINQSNNNELLFTLLLTPKEERSISSGEFVNQLNIKYQDRYPNGDFSASQLSGGPPAGSDIQIKLLGEDPLILDQYAKKLEEYLKSQSGVSQVKSSLETGSGKIVFVPDQRRLIELGITNDTIAYWIRALGSGTTVVEDARFGEEKRDIIIRMNEAGLSSPEDITRFTIPTPSGELISLSSLGHFELTSNPTRITREDGKQTLSVTAAVADNYSVSTINKDLEGFAKTLDLPTGYSWKTGGVNEENDKSVTSILEAMLLSAILIFATMTIQFRSFRKSVIVLLVIPLAVSGVFIVFALTGTPLSFPALIGILALFGIVVNNSIIMVDKINRNMDKGQKLIDAISEGASSRLEPILLTAITTIVGLIPITLSDPIWQGLGGAIIAGLLFSGIAKLFMIPVLYWAFYGEQEDAR